MLLTEEEARNLAKESIEARGRHRKRSAVSKAYSGTMLRLLHARPGRA